eukprot:TRINITY_DN82_c0_g1_i1.p1 TRINITY_DN82_c0_g1~~TRINITY_DN82_c0_g1_i1.p1  ORF type:complete len:120 (+),score=23.73 TRINITY_DN82_c0_g1_i1:84-443(+)
MQSTSYTSAEPVSQPATAYTTTSYTTTTPVYGYPTTTYTAYPTTTGSGGSRGSGYLDKVTDGISSMMSNRNQPGAESYRSDFMGGYTYHGADGSYEKKHRFTRRVTRRGPGSASTYGSA